MPKQKQQRELEDYPHRRIESVRYSDTDRQGHVNNAIFLTFFECSRSSILHDPNRGLRSQGCEFVIVATEMQFLKEIHWPGDVTIGTGIVRIGNSSMTSEQAIFQNGLCVAMSKSTMVMVDAETKKSTPLNDVVINNLKDLTL